MSYESNRSIDGFQRSQYLPKKGKKTQHDNRKSTTNLLPSRSKKPKFILKKQGQDRYVSNDPIYRPFSSSIFRANKDLMMDNYLKQFS